MTHQGIAAFTPNKIQVLVFDADDTVTRGSLSLKASVWEEMFGDAQDAVTEARALYEATGNGDRYNIIAHILNESQEDCRTNPTILAVAEEFETRSTQKIRDEGMHPDDVAALVDLRKKFEGAMYIVSATPQSSVGTNIDFFMNQYPELNHVFVEVVGTPLKQGKAGEIVRIAQKHDCQLNEVLMIGDGSSDYKGANEAGSQFVAIIPDGKPDKWPNENFPKLVSIAEIPILVN